MKLRNKSFKISLFWKFALASTFVVIIFGAINIFLLWSSVYTSFELEIDKRCTVLATIISEKAVSPLVYEDELALHNILNEIKQSDPSISYAFILDKDQRIIAQTFDINIPKELITINTLIDGQYSIKVIETNHFKYPVVRDIAYPILNGSVGTVRMGIVEDHIQQDISKATKNLILMIIAFLIFGLIGAFFFSYIITAPIKSISKKAQNIDLNLIELEAFSFDSKKMLPIVNIQFDDELDVLVEKFSEMLNRLRNSYLDLNETQKALIQAEKLASLGTFSAGIAHEINNPISGILNCLNRIIKDPENVEQNSKYAILIKDAINKIENVVQHLLNFSRKHDIDLKPTNLNAVIKQSVELISYKLKTLKVKVDIDDTEMLYVMGSANHLEQTLVNLLINGHDAIVERKKKEPELEELLDISYSRKAGNVCIRVSDNGIGIASSDEGNVFDPFYTSKDVGKGTGLGLSVSFNLIKEHKGNIYFKSEVGQGTSFFIELPIYTKS